MQAFPQFGHVVLPGALRCGLLTDVAPWSLHVQDRFARVNFTSDSPTFLPQTPINGFKSMGGSSGGYSFYPFARLDRPGLTNALTVESWLVPVAAGWQVLAANYRNGAGNYGWGVLFDGAGKPLFSTNSSLTNAVYSSVALSLNVTHHFVITVDASNVSFYFDGVLSNTQAATSPPVPVWGATYGMVGINSADPAPGRVGVVRVWDRVLTAQAVRQLYTIGRGAAARQPALKVVSSFKPWLPALSRRAA
jgi:hypothetical protein